MSDSTVSLTVPATAPFASVARSTTVRMAALSGLTVEQVEDVRLAVSETFAALITRPDIITVQLAFTARTSSSAAQTERSSQQPAAASLRVVLRATCAGELERASEADLSWTLAKELVDTADWLGAPAGVTVELTVAAATVVPLP